MTYTIYNKEGEKRTDFDSSSSCTHVHKIQSDNVLNLSFTLYDYIVLDVNDYIDIGSDRFTLTDPYKPLMKSTLEYQYDVKFYGAESIAKKAVFLDTEYNPITSYFDTPSAQLSYIVKCINRVIGQERYHVGAVIASEPILVSYQSGCTCLQALDALSKVVKTEWWLDGTSFNLNKCEHSNPVVLGYAKGLLQLSKDISENKEFYTRLIPRGSSKNIIASDYGHATLQLPEGVKYIDRDVDNYGIVEHYEEVAFQDIFPRFEGKVMSVRTEQRTIEKIDRIIYYFTDPTIPFNPNDYEQPGKIKHIVFKSGDLQGQDFEANYNAERKEWELILQYPSKDMQLPGGNVIPRLNDIYTVYNIKLPREYYPLAEKEFVDAVNKLLAEHAVDYAVYKATTDSVYLEENNINLSIGQRVKLLSEEYFSEGYRNSRITSITRKLSNLNDMDIDISNTIVKSGYASLKEDVSSLKSAVSERLAQDMLNIIRSYQQADMTDENVLSSKRTLNEIAKNAISKTQKDIAEKEITFKEGLTSSDLVKLLKGLQVSGGADIDNLHIIDTLAAKLVDAISISTTKIDTQKADVLELVVNVLATIQELKVNGKSSFKDDLSSSDYASKLLGWIIDAAGNAELKSLRVRDFLEADEYRYNRVSVVAGEQWNSVGGGIIESVDATNNILCLKLESGEMAQLDIDDICKGIYNDSKGFQTCFFRVTEKLGESTFRYALRPNYNYSPSKLMHFVAYGNFTNKDRQKSSYSTQSYKRYLTGVNGWEITKEMIAMQLGDLSNLILFGINMTGHSAYLRNIYMTGTIKQISSDGVTESRVPCFKGEWIGGTYYYYDEVTHNGSSWLSISEKPTTQEPCESSNDWLEKSAKGKDAVVISIFSSNGNVFQNGSVSTRLTAVVTKGNIDITDSIPPSRFSWEKESLNKDTDKIFNQTHVGYGHTIDLSTSDIYGRATFNCIVSL